MKLHVIWLWVAAAVCLLPSCTPLESQSVEYVRDDSRSLRRALFDHGKMVLVYGTAEKHRSEYAQWANQLAANSQRIKIAVYSDQDILEDELTQNPVFLVGSFSQNSMVKDFLQRLPFTQVDGTFEYQGVKIHSENDLGILSFYPNPYAPHFPVGAVLGTDDQEILNFVKQNEGSRIFRTLWSRWGYQIYQNGQRTLLGNFNQEWQPDSLQQWTFSHDLTPAIETQHFQFYSYTEDLSNEDLTQISRNCEARIQEMISFVNNGKEHTIPKIGMYIYPSAEQMGLMHNQMSQSFIDPTRNEAHVIINEEYIGNYVEKENQLVLTYLLGKSSLPTLEEGMAIYFAPQWQQKGYLHWSAALTRSHNIIPLKELLDPNYYQEESPLVRGAMAGSFVGFLIQNWGKEEFLQRYSSWQPSSNEIASLEPDWISYLQTQADQIPLPERRSYQNQYFKGMTFSHEGYNIYDGYGSKIGASSLEAIKSIYANAVAIVPYSGSRSIYSPAPFHFSEGAGGENDASVVCSHHFAKQLGLMTMLKPQLWFPGAWPGEVEMKTEEDWDQFFTYYRRWIRHYAMLAEIHQMDIFCAGVEFVKTTR
ncbi:MAG: hypothetical protein KDD99_26830, partial [Bacteroidetes bacterium]|nr:hypothetical protein [Bacteroidota bacterium]